MLKMLYTACPDPSLDLLLD